VAIPATGAERSMTREFLPAAVAAAGAVSLRPTMWVPALVAAACARRQDRQPIISSNRDQLHH
jgi:hypothetical protein